MSPFSSTAMRASPNDSCRSRSVSVAWSGISTTSPLTVICMSGPSGLQSQHAPGQQGPASQKRDAAEWRNSAEPANAAQGQNIQTARKQYDSKDEQPATDAHGRLGRIVQRQEPHSQQRQRAVHMMLHPGLERLEKFGRDCVAQAMCGESAEGDSQEAIDAAQYQEEMRHGWFPVQRQIVRRQNQKPHSSTPCGFMVEKGSGLNHVSDLVHGIFFQLANTFR